MFKYKDVPGTVRTSAVTGYGVDDLLNKINAEVSMRAGNMESSAALSQRATAHLKGAADELKSALDNSGNMDIFAEHVRLAASHIGQMLGVIDTSEVFDKVFSNMCLGK